MKFILPKDHDWRNESPCTSRPQSLDFDVNEFLRSTPNPGDCEIIQKAAVRREYPVTRSRFSNFGDDIHDQLVRERITSAIQRIPPRLLILAFPSRFWSPILNYATSLRAILEWVVSLCEIQEATGNMLLLENLVGASRWYQSSIKRLRNAPFSFEGISHLCMFEVKDLRSRSALKRRAHLGKNDYSNAWYRLNFFELI